MEAQVLNFAWVYVLLWLSILGAQDSSVHASAIKLYQQAAILLPNEPDLAIPVLEELMNQFPDSILAPVAAQRVAEQSLSKGDYHAAINLLLKWAPRAAELDADGKIARVDPNCAKQLQLLVTHGLSNLPDSEWSWLESWLEKSRAEQAPKQNVASDQRQFQRSLPQAWVVGELVRRSIRAANEPRIQQMLDSPSIRELLTPSERLSLVLTFAESRRGARDYQGSLQVLEHHRQWLADLADNRPTAESDQVTATQSPETNLAGDSSNTDSSELRHWLATIDLRRGELHLLLGNYQLALKIASDSLELYRGYPGLIHYRFLQANGYIAAVEFEQSRIVLRQMLQEQDDGAVRAQAWWMLGEVDFFQNQYVEAIANYQRAAEESNPEIWRARALLQAGKCHERLGKVLDAIVAYQNTLALRPSEDVAKCARERLEILSAFDGTLGSTTSRNTPESTPKSR